MVAVPVPEVVSELFIAKVKEGVQLRIPLQVTGPLKVEVDPAPPVVV